MSRPEQHDQGEHVSAVARPMRRLAMISLHTSPLDQPGTGDAGGMNVYVIELARRLARQGIEVDVFTRATSSRLGGAAFVIRLPLAR